MKRERVYGCVLLEFVASLIPSDHNQSLAPKEFHSAICPSFALLSYLNLFCYFEMHENESREVCLCIS